MRRTLIAGNWKMNGLRADGQALAAGLAERARNAMPEMVELLVCPPATLLGLVGEALSGVPIALGGQDCHPEESGPHTGDIAAPMLRDMGCAYVIVGHSERRADHGESDALVHAKAAAALRAGLSPIVCVGETAHQRGKGQALPTIEKQVRGSLPEPDGGGEVVIAYEPVWAIGTGNTATSDDVAEVHGHIRSLLGSLWGDGRAAQTRILYGGSVKPGNAGELLALDDVDGALVGGASLKAEDFWAIAAARE